MVALIQRVSPAVVVVELDPERERKLLEQVGCLPSPSPQAAPCCCRLWPLVEAKKPAAHACLAFAAAATWRMALPICDAGHPAIAQSRGHVRLAFQFARRRKRVTPTA